MELLDCFLELSTCGQLIGSLLETKRVDSAVSNCVKSYLDLVTVLEAIMTSMQPSEKLHCLYENLLSNNFQKMAVLKKYELQT